MPARRPLRLAQAIPLAALLLAPSMARAQGSSSVVARATVAAARAPRLELSIAEAPVVVSMRRGGRAGAAKSGAVQVTSAVRVAGNAGYRLFVRARSRAAGAGVAVRDASGTFRSLAGGAVVEVARGTGREGARDVVYRLDGATAAELPVVYELVYDPVS